MNRDPIEENGGTNLYAYVANDPVSTTDALGTMASKASLFRGILNVPKAPGSKIFTMAKPPGTQPPKDDWRRNLQSSLDCQDCCKLRRDNENKVICESGVTDPEELERLEAEVKERYEQCKFDCLSKPWHCWHPKNGPPPDAKPDSGKSAGGGGGGGGLPPTHKKKCDDACE